jgi:heptosyltransferase-3
VIHPFSGGAKKNWPLSNFRQVAAQLGDVRWLAGPEETLDGATRFDSLLDVAHLIAGAKRYIGNDSGITHLAAAVGAHVIAIFGPTDPRVWAPRGANVHVLIDPTPEEVLRLC